MSQSYKELFNLSGKTAIITGGVGILGVHFCAGLAEYGANVVIIDLHEDIVTKAAMKLEKEYYIRSIGIVCDISDPESVKQMVNRTVSEFGEIHILHNNAQYQSEYVAPFEEYSYDEWRKAMSVNIDGYFLVAQVVGQQMVKQGKGGSIIQTSSIYGLMAPDQRIYKGSFYQGREINAPAVYTASKAAVIGLTKYLASYWAPHRIRVNTLSPGGVESGQNEEFQKRYSARIPLGRMGFAYEIVGALIYLASDASSYVTGQNIVVDGGLNAW